MARTRGRAAAQDAAQAAALAKQKADAAAASANAVFGTAELLEMILLHLPLNQVLVAQRVSAFWKAGITQSRKLQQAVYLRPVGKHLVQVDDTSEWLHGDWTTIGEEDNGTMIRPILNPVMPRYFFTWFNNFVSILDVGFITPIFDRTAYALTYRERRAHPEPETIGPRNRNQLRALHRSDASWKNMLLMQPPCSEISIVCGKRNRLFKITNPQGVTLQDLRSGLWSHLADCPMCTDRCVTYGRVIPRWDFVGSRSWNIQHLRDTPSSAELLDCLERPEVAPLPGVLDD